MPFDDDIPSDTDPISGRRAFNLRPDSDALRHPAHSSLTNAAIALMGVHERDQPHQQGIAAALDSGHDFATGRLYFFRDSRSSVSRSCHARCSTSSSDLAVLSIWSGPHRATGPSCS